VLLLRFKFFPHYFKFQIILFEVIFSISFVPIYNSFDIFIKLLSFLVCNCFGI
jgi:hypothetical protein